MLNLVMPLAVAAMVTAVPPDSEPVPEFDTPIATAAAECAAIVPGSDDIDTDETEWSDIVVLDQGHSVAVVGQDELPYEPADIERVDGEVVITPGTTTITYRMPPGFDCLLTYIYSPRWLWYWMRQTSRTVGDDLMDGALIFDLTGEVDLGEYTVMWLIRDRPNESVMVIYDEEASTAPEL